MTNLQTYADNSPERLIEKLSEVENDYRNFSYAISHDLSAPVRGITGFWKIFLDEYYNEESTEEDGRRIVNLLTKNIHHLNQMIESVLQFSRIQRITPERERVDLGGVVNEICKRLTVRFGSHYRLRTTDHLLVLNSDSNLCHTFLNCVLENAFLYSSREESPEIRIELEVPENRICRMIISDNGAGFNLEKAEKIFTLFQRFHSQSEFPGLGAGLALAAAAVHKLDGTIKLESAPKKGTVVRIEIPADKL